jgi:hypothetical protein
LREATPPLLPPEGEELDALVVAVVEQGELQLRGVQVCQRLALELSPQPPPGPQHTATA